MGRAQFAGVGRKRPVSSILLATPVLLKGGQADRGPGEPEDADSVSIGLVGQGLQKLLGEAAAAGVTC